MSEKLVNIIDADTIIYICCHNKKDETIKSLSEVFTQVDLFVNTILRDTKSTHYLMYLTVGRGNRYYVNPDYKKNREGKEKPPMFDFVKEYLITKYKAVFKDGFESDDLCLSSKKILDKQRISCIISSPDKDLLYTLGTHWDYMKKKYIETNKEQTEFNFWGKLIWGDSSDGVQGIPKKGPKYVEQLFASCHWSFYPQKVFEAYTNYYREQGIEEMYKTYKCLKILDTIPGYVLPDLQEVKSGYELYKEELNDKTT